MTVMISNDLREKLKRVKKREWWPVATLARILKKPKSFIYRRIEDDDFDVLFDGGFRKVSSESVERYFTEKCM